MFRLNLLNTPNLHFLLLILKSSIAHLKIHISVIATLENDKISGIIFSGYYTIRKCRSLKFPNLVRVAPTDWPAAFGLIFVFPWIDNLNAVDAY